MSLRVVQSMCVAMVFSMVLLSLGIALSLPLYILLKVLQIKSLYHLKHLFL